MRGSTSERGSVTVLMVAMVVVAFVLVIGAGRLGEVVVARARAQSAADAAALAAADQLALGRGGGSAVDAAEQTAAANGARLTRCACSGVVAEVDVEVDAFRTVRARARAEVSPQCVIDGLCAEPGDGG